MRPGPITFRPDVLAGALPDYVRTLASPLAIVTTSDGVLIGLLDAADPGLERGPGMRHRGGRHRAGTAVAMSR